MKFWVHIIDCGDGSARAEPYATEAEAQEAADKEVEDFGYALSDNVHSIELGTCFLLRVGVREI